MGWWKGDDTAAAELAALDPWAGRAERFVDGGRVLGRANNSADGDAFLAAERLRQRWRFLAIVAHESSCEQN